MRAKSAYNALLHCYPAAFRHEYGNQMLLMFAEQLGEARRTGGRLEPAALWLHAASDALTIAPKEHCHVILQDLRYALRTMAASPGFTAVAILSLALGIGANTAIFSLWNGVLHRSLPAVYKPEQLVMLSNPDDAGMWSGQWDPRADGPRSWLTYAEFEQLRDHAEGFSSLMASQSSLDSWQVRLDGGEWEEASGRLVSGGFFQVLGVSPLIGRVFTTAEDRAGTPSVVISYNYWQRRFGGRPDVLGKALIMRKAALTIIGVAPSGFIGETNGQQPDLWISMRMQPSVIPGRDWLHDTPPSKAMWLNVFGRLKPAVTPARAEAQANAVFQAGLESFYGAAASSLNTNSIGLNTNSIGERRHDFQDERLRIRPGAGGASETRHDFSLSLTALLAAVGVLLLIACANLANLLLARGAARRPEIALRLSLGASRGRLIRQLVTESLALAAIGGVAGLGAAWFLHGALVRMMAESDRRFHMSFALDPLVLAFALAATLTAVLLFGVFPAWHVTKGDAGTALKEQGRNTGSLGRLSTRGPRSGRFLVSLQLALSLPLLVGAGLLARTVYNLQRADLGYPAQRLLLVRVNSREAGYDAARFDSLHRELAGQFQRIPGVRAVSFSELGVFSGGNSISGIEVEGYTPKEDRDRHSALDVVGAGYFRALGVPIAMGREILESDHAAAPRVCVINEAFAKRFFDRRNPVGMRITSIGEKDRTPYQVVGVAKNAHTHSLRGNVEPRYFVPAAQPPSSVSSPTFLIRTATGTAPVMAAVRKAIQRVDAALPIESARSIEERMAPLTAQDRTTAQLAVAFGCAALTLAAIGLYGVLGYGIARRRGEIAVRIALGAQPGRVVAMILRETIGTVIAGLALGAGLAYTASRLIDSRLYGVAPQDPPTLALAAGLLVLVAIGAAYLPARRASRLDPMAALRQE
ncbi:MAG TPA: ABC transporter permease [Candidatus Acidoferrales bacterium]|nr:ABC transporter permease [Candidatus Acidoferrales bacterium]